MKTIDQEIQDFLNTNKPWTSPHYVADFFERQKINKIVAAKRLRTKAVDNHGHVYECYLYMENLGSGYAPQGKTSDDDYRNGLTLKWVLRIGDTPGHWCMTTLLESGSFHSGISIHGNDWYCTNFQQVLDEAKKLI